MKKQVIILSMVFISSLSLYAQTELSLSEIKQKAVEHNIQIRSANRSIAQAQEQRKEAFTNYFPQVQATGLGFKSSTSIIKTELRPSELLPSSLAQALPSEMVATIPSTIPFGMIDRGVMVGVTLVQPVFMGGQIVNGNKLAKVGEEVSRLQKRTSQNAVELTAEQYYWQIVTLQEKMKTLDAVSVLLEKYEKDAAVLVKAGIGMRNDLLSVQLKQNEVESNRIKLENGLKLSRMVLAQYIGMEGKEINVKIEVNPEQMPAYPTLKVDHSEAVSATPEYHLLQKNVEATTLQRKMEVGKHLPSVAVGAGYNYYDMGKGTDSNFGAIFATVSVPISSWWGGSHAIKRKKLAEENAREQLTDNAQLLKIRMQKNWNDVDDAYKQLALAKKSIEQSEENLRLNRDYYQAGTVTMNDLLDAQQKYQQCRDRYTDAYAQLQTKIVEYKQSIGQ